MASPLLRSLLRRLWRTRSSETSEEENVPLGTYPRIPSFPSQLGEVGLGEMALGSGGRDKPLPPLPHEIDPGLGQNQDCATSSSPSPGAEYSREVNRRQAIPNFSRQLLSTFNTETTRPRRFQIENLTDSHPDDVFVDNLANSQNVQTHSQAGDSFVHAITTSEDPTDIKTSNIHDYRNDESVWFASSLGNVQPDRTSHDDTGGDIHGDSQEIDHGPENFQPSPNPSDIDDDEHMHVDSDLDVQSQNHRHSGNDFFAKYFDAMKSGTEHSWTAALCQSDLSDKALADAYLSNLPHNTLQRHFQSSETRASSYTAAMNSSQDLYSFGSSPQSYSRRSGLRAHKMDPHRINIPPKETDSVVPPQLSPICEERESMLSLPALSETQVSSPSIPTSSKVKQFSKCDDCGSSSPTHCTPCKKVDNRTYSSAQRQTLLLKVLAAAATQVSPFHFIYNTFRTHEPAVLAYPKRIQQGQDLHTEYVLPQLSLCNALRAVMKTTCEYKNATVNARLDENGIPMKQSVLFVSIGKLALVAASVLALEAATSQAEGGVRQDTGLILAAKNAGAETREFCNRVFEILAIFRVTDGCQSHQDQGACLRVLDVCANAVDDEMWKLWQQMHGGINESGQRMSDTIHWDIMVEVAREAISVGFIDIGRLKPMCEAIDRAAALKWMAL